MAPPERAQQDHFDVFGKSAVDMRTVRNSRNYHHEMLSMPIVFVPRRYLCVCVRVFWTVNLNFLSFRSTQNQIKCDIISVCIILLIKDDDKFDSMVAFGCS